jgi:hypothetical protein
MQMPSGTITLGRLFDLDFLMQPRSFAIGSALLCALLALIASVVLGWPLASALFGGLCGTTLHWLLDIAHNIGHAIAARRSGFAMRGVLLGEKLIFGRSLYPDAEPALHARIHIMRALGGPLLSTVLGAALAALTVVLWPSQGLAAWLCAWATLESFAIFGPGAFAPLDFTDGGTLLKWWPQRNAA